MENHELHPYMISAWPQCRGVLYILAVSAIVIYLIWLQGRTYQANPSAHVITTLYPQNTQCWTLAGFCFYQPWLDS